MADSILVQAYENWTEITLSRPGRLNSLNDETHLAPLRAIEEAQGRRARAILLTGAGRGNCAGQDLGNRDPSMATIGHASRHLPRLLGEARAKGLAFTAQQAEDRGLVWKGVPDEMLMTEARAMTESFANGPTLGLGLSKEAIQAAAKDTLDDHLDLEVEYMKTCGESTGNSEVVSAFLQKRAPAFKGK